MVLYVGWVAYLTVRLIYLVEQFVYNPLNVHCTLYNVQC